MESAYVKDKILRLNIIKLLETEVAIQISCLTPPLFLHPLHHYHLPVIHVVQARQKISKFLTTWIVVHLTIIVISLVCLGSN